MIRSQFGWIALAGLGAASCRAVGTRSSEDLVWEFLLARYDRDGDELILRAEYERGEDAFSRLDRDRDGALERADLDRPITLPPDDAAPYLLVSALGAEGADSLGPLELRIGFERRDLDQDGRLEREELERAAPARDATQNYDVFATLLAAIDRTSDGTLELPELTAYLEARDRDRDGRLHAGERAAPGEAPRLGWIDPAERERAPDFSLHPYQGGAAVRLSSFVGRKPVVLVFGSFT
jgi:Ca2+-binding EF-hand superfamily protein